MNQKPTNLTATEVAVDAMINFASEIFDDNFIMDLGVRRTVAKMALESGNFVDHFGDKFDLEQLISGGTESRDIFEISKINVGVSVGMTPAEKSQLILANPDVNVVFHEHSTLPHGKSYSQRIVDTTRLLTKVNHRSGSVLDMGGNYAAHAFCNHNFEVHSCTLKCGAREYHRQVQRDVRLDYADVAKVLKCTDGVEECDYQSREGISLHTLPDIDPAKLPAIFRRHGLVHMEGLHHFDVNIETGSAGFIPEADMHWRTVGENVEFFFEADSSEGYVHKRAYLLEYATSWTRSMDDWEYAIHYSVNMITNGLIYWTITRLEKATVGHFYTRPQHRYMPTEQVVELMVPEFDASLGFAVGDPRAYKIALVPCPAEMFTHVYKFGISNDTERPDLPLTFEHIKNQVQVFNQVRKVNGSPITVKKKLDTMSADRIALGMYLLIVKKAASNAVVYGEYTLHLKRIQNRWGDESFVHLVCKVFGSVAMFPFIALASTFQDVVSLMTVHMRSVVTDDRVLAAAQDVVPYRLLKPIRVVGDAPTGVYKSEQLQTHDRVDFDDVHSVRKFYDIFRNEMSETQRERLEKYLSTEGATKDSDTDSGGDASDNDVGLEADEVQDHARDLRTQRSNNTESYSATRAKLLDCSADREEWYTAQENMNECFGVDSDHFVDVDLEYNPVEADKSVVFQYARERVYEYGLYCIDVGLHELQKAREFVAASWNGSEPLAQQIHEQNVLVGAELVYKRVVDNVILDLDVKSEYTIGMNPDTKETVKVLKTANKWSIVGNYAATYVAFCKQFKIFNHFPIANTCISLARSSRPIVPVEMSLVDGIPGCGKTYEIVNAFDMTDIIVCVVRSSVAETAWQIFQRFKEKYSLKRIESRVRTMDSFLMHPEHVPLAKRMWFDEGLMTHSGPIMALAILSRAKAVYAFGDTRQIKMIERGSKMGIMRFPLFKYWTKVSQRNETVRLPADITMLISADYPVERRRLIKTRSNVLRSISYQNMPDIENALFKVAKPYYTYISVLQADKGMVLKGKGFQDGKLFDAERQDNLTAAIRPVYSVHESQGRTFAAVQVNRLNPQTVGIFDSPAHMLVMISRCTHRVLYASVAQFAVDTMAKRIDAIKSVSDEELQQFTLPTPDWLKKYLDKIAKTMGLVD